jgi:hypothetical protein
MPAIFLCFFKDGQWSDIQALFDQIVTKVQMQIPAQAVSFDGDPSYNFRLDNCFIWWVDRYRDNGRHLDELLNSLDEMHVTVPINDPFHPGKNFRSRLPKYVLMIPTTNGVRPVNLSVIKAVLGLMPALNDASRLGQMREFIRFRSSACKIS